MVVVEGGERRRREPLSSPQLSRRSRSTLTLVGFLASPSDLPGCRQVFAPVGIFKPAPSGLRAGRDLVGFLASPGSREWLGLGSPEGLTQVGEGRGGAGNGGRAKVAKWLRIGEVLGAEIPRTFTTNSTTIPDATIWTRGSSPPPR